MSALTTSTVKLTATMAAVVIATSLEVSVGNHGKCNGSL